MKKIRSKKESKNQFVKRVNAEVDGLAIAVGRQIADRAITTVAEWIEHRKPVYPDGSPVTLDDIFGPQL